MTNRLFNEANSIWCSIYVRWDRRGQVISCFWDMKIYWSKRSREGRKETTTKYGEKGEADDKEKKNRVDNSMVFMHERQWFFPHLSVLHVSYIHLPRHRACQCMLAMMWCRTRSTNERHKYMWREGEGWRKENDGVVRCSSCGTNLIPLRFFSCFLVPFLMLMRFLSLTDISSSNSNRPTLTYKKRKSAYTHTYILTRRLGHALIYNVWRKWRKAFGCLRKD